MRWEELKVYKPLAKEELKPAFKAFTKILADNLKPFGFTLHGRKLVAQSHDLLQVIHLDTRGSWTGISEYFKTEVAVVAASDKSPFIRGFELTGSKKIEDITIGIKDHYRITQEYPLLADFLTRKIIDCILPYFDKYSSSKKVLTDRKRFLLDDIIQRNDHLILFCELQNRTNIEASKIVDKTLAFYSSLHTGKNQLNEYLEELEFYQSSLADKDWPAIEKRLETNKNEVFRKLKMKPADNTSLLP